MVCPEQVHCGLYRSKSWGIGGKWGSNTIEKLVKVGWVGLSPSTRRTHCPFSNAAPPKALTKPTAVVLTKSFHWRAFEGLRVGKKLPTRLSFIHYAIRQ